MRRKRGRPISTEDLSKAERREQVRLATQRYRERQQRRRVTAEQEAQIARIIERPNEEDMEAAETLSSLGLRVQGVTIARSSDRAQDKAAPVEEHEALYDAEAEQTRVAQDVSARNESALTVASSSRSGHNGLSRKQQGTIEQFIDITCQGPEVALSCLTKCQWDLAVLFWFLHFVLLRERHSYTNQVTSRMRFRAFSKERRPLSAP